MTKPLITLLLTLAVALPGLAREPRPYPKGDRPDLDMDNIPQNLKENAFAVVRYSTEEVELDARTGTVYRISHAVSILNERGKAEGEVRKYYSKEESLHGIKASVFDGHGHLLTQVKESEFNDLSAVDGFSMYLDERYKKYTPKNHDYPYTVVYEAETRNRNLFSLPYWLPQIDAGVSVQQSSFSLLARDETPVRIHEWLAGAPVTDTQKGAVTKTWSLKNAVAFRAAPLCGTELAFVPHVYLSPGRYKVAGKFDDVADWNDYGKWMYEHFLKDATTLPEETRTAILSRTSKVSEPLEKAKIVYAWVQQKMRYVSVQIGMGGFKTQTAAEVDRQGYGDCKGLVNYTRALLKVCGINAFYTEVFAGEEPHPLYPEFAWTGASNHIILCLPMGRDTTWLECTNRDLPFGYLGNFTDDRMAIMDTPEGGKLVHTPVYREENNLQTRKISFTIDREGNAQSQINTRSRGLQYENHLGLNDLAGQEKEEYIKSLYPFDRIEVSSFDLRFDKGKDPVALESLHCSIPLFATPDRNALLVPTTPLDRLTALPIARHARVRPLVIRSGYRDIDSTEYILPKDFSVKSLPENQHLSGQFGKYSMEFHLQANRLLIVRSLSMHAGTFKPEDYNAYLEFRETVRSFDFSAVRLEPAG